MDRPAAQLPEPPRRLSERLREAIGLKPDADRADLAKVLAGTLARNLLRGALKLLVAGFLAPSALGVLRSVYSLFQIAVRLAEFGLEYALVTFLSAARSAGDRTGQTRILDTVLALELAISAGILLVGVLLAPQIASGLLGDRSLALWVRVAFSAVGGQLLWGYLSSYLTSRQDFARLAAYLACMPALMLLAAASLVGLGCFDTSAAILVYLLAPAATVLIWWLIARRPRFRPAWDGPTARRVVRFSRWIYLTSACSALRNHGNTLLVKSPALAGSVARGEMDAGLYAFGADLAGEIAILSESLMLVLLPKASGLSRQQLGPFLARAYRTVAVLLIPVALLALLARPLLQLLGWIKASYLDYLPSLSIFYLLLLGGLFSLAAIPLRSVLYALERPEIEARLEALMLVLMLGSSAALIPHYGGVGAALAMLGQRAISCLALWIATAVCLRAARRQEP
ncbi:MAG: oligosaccharide flippase family protein [Deltaproteobacteria bacterium]|nr:oligosaccharide flippase family protein [Deltaproteobacteria bacterium]